MKHVMNTKKLRLGLKSERVSYIAIREVAYLHQMNICKIIKFLSDLTFSGKSSISFSTFDM